MKKIVLLIELFLSLQISLHAQTYYINGTTDISLGNKALLQSNELKIGNSASATERAKNMIKIGDGSYIQLGEWEADNQLSFKASKYNFTGGYVGIGTTSPTALLEVNGTVKATSLSLTGSLTAGSLKTSDDLWIGNTAAAVNSYGKKLYFGINENTDPVYMARYNVSDVVSELRVNVGDDKYDSFVVGSKLYTAMDFVPMFTVKMDGNVGIGTSNPANKLDVNGIIRATEIKIASGWADFVFHDDYPLKPLSEVNRFIKENRHLPEIPSAEEVESNNGVNLGEMQVKLLQKVEELTLYLIQQDNTIRELKNEIRELKDK